jgi:hypothetical protein
MSRLISKSAKRAPLFENLRGLGGFAKRRVGCGGCRLAHGARRRQPGKTSTAPRIEEHAKPSGGHPPQQEPAPVSPKRSAWIGGQGTVP